MVQALKKIISLLIVLSMTAQTALAGMPAGNATAPAIENSAQNLWIPSEWGQIGQVSQNPSPQGSVILIQDAHGNESAQRNIAHLIEFLSQKYSTRLLLSEGASGKLELANANLGDDRDQVAEVSELLLKEGYLNGLEYAIVRASRNNNVDYQAWGMEDPTQYHEAFDLIRELFKHEAQSLEWKELWSQTWRHQASLMMNRDLLTLMNEKEKYLSGMRRIDTYSQYLLKMASDIRGLDESKSFVVEDYEALARFQSLQENSSEVDAPEQLDAEWRSWKSSIEPDLTLPLLEMLDPSVNQKMVTQIPYRRLIEAVFLKSPEAQKALENLPTLRSAIERRILLDELDPKKINQEIETLEAFLLESLTGSKEETKLIDLYRRFEMSYQILTGEARQDEWQACKHNPVQCQPSKLMESLQSDAITSDTETLLFQDDLFAKAHRFYELSDLREIFMAQKTLQALKENKVKTAILFAGGFHEEGLRRIFTDAQMNFISIAPHLNVINKNENPYRARLLDFDQSITSETKGAGVVLEQVLSSEPSDLIFYSQFSPPQQRSLMAGSHSVATSKKIQEIRASVERQPSRRQLGVGQSYSTRLASSLGGYDLTDYGPIHHSGDLIKALRTFLINNDFVSPEEINAMVRSLQQHDLESEIIWKNRLDRTLVLLLEESLRRQPHLLETYFNLDIPSDDSSPAGVRLPSIRKLTLLEAAVEVASVELARLYVQRIYDRADAKRQALKESESRSFFWRLIALGALLVAGGQHLINQVMPERGMGPVQQVRQQMDSHQVIGLDVQTQGSVTNIQELLDQNLPGTQISQARMGLNGGPIFTVVDDGRMPALYVYDQNTQRNVQLVTRSLPTTFEGDYSFRIRDIKSGKELTLTWAQFPEPKFTIYWKSEDGKQDLSLSYPAQRVRQLGAHALDKSDLFQPQGLQAFSLGHELGSEKFPLAGVDQVIRQLLLMGHLAPMSTDQAEILLSALEVSAGGNLDPLIEELSKHLAPGIQVDQTPFRAIHSIPIKILFWTWNHTSETNGNLTEILRDAVQLEKSIKKINFRLQLALSAIVLFAGIDLAVEGYHFFTQKADRSNDRLVDPDQPVAQSLGSLTRRDFLATGSAALFAALVAPRNAWSQPAQNPESEFTQEVLTELRHAKTLLFYFSGSEVAEDQLKQALLHYGNYGDLKDKLPKWKRELKQAREAKDIREDQRLNIIFKEIGVPLAYHSLSGDVVFVRNGRLSAQALKFQQILQSVLPVLRESDSELNGGEQGAEQKFNAEFAVQQIYNRVEDNDGNPVILVNRINFFKPNRGDDLYGYVPYQDKWIPFLSELEDELIRRDARMTYSAPVGQPVMPVNPEILKKEVLAFAESQLQYIYSAPLPSQKESWDLGRHDALKAAYEMDSRIGDLMSLIAARTGTFANTSEARDFYDALNRELALFGIVVGLDPLGDWVDAPSAYKVRSLMELQRDYLRAGEFPGIVRAAVIEPIKGAGLVYRDLAGRSGAILGKGEIFKPTLVLIPKQDYKLASSSVRELIKLAPNELKTAKDKSDWAEAEANHFLEFAEMSRELFILLHQHHGSLDGNLSLAARFFRQMAPFLFAPNSDRAEIYMKILYQQLIFESAGQYAASAVPEATSILELLAVNATQFSNLGIEDAKVRAFATALKMKQGSARNVRILNFMKDLDRWQTLLLTALTWKTTAYLDQFGSLEIPRHREDQALKMGNFNSVGFLNSLVLGLRHWTGAEMNHAFRFNEIQEQKNPQILFPRRHKVGLSLGNPQESEQLEVKVIEELRNVFVPEDFYVLASAVKTVALQLGGGRYNWQGFPGLAEETMGRLQDLFAFDPATTIREREALLQLAIATASNQSENIGAGLRDLFTYDAEFAVLTIPVPKELSLDETEAILLEYKALFALHPNRKIMLLSESNVPTDLIDRLYEQTGVYLLTDPSYQQVEQVLQGNFRNGIETNNRASVMRFYNDAQAVLGKNVSLQEIRNKMILSAEASLFAKPALSTVAKQFHDTDLPGLSMADQFRAHLLLLQYTPFEALELLRRQPDEIEVRMSGPGISFFYRQSSLGQISAMIQAVQAVLTAA